MKTSKGVDQKTIYQRSTVGRYKLIFGGRYRSTLHTSFIQWQTKFVSVTRMKKYRVN